MGKLDDEYNELKKAEKNDFCSRYNDDWFMPPLENDEKLLPMLPLEGDED